MEPEHIIIIHIQLFLILCRLLLSKNLATFKICLPHTPTSDIKFISLLIYPEDSLWQKIPSLVHPDHWGSSREQWILSVFESEMNKQNICFGWNLLLQDTLNASCYTGTLGIPMVLGSYLLPSSSHDICLITLLPITPHFLKSCFSIIQHTALEGWFGIPKMNDFMCICITSSVESTIS